MLVRRMQYEQDKKIYWKRKFEQFDENVIIHTR